MTETDFSNMKYFVILLLFLSLVTPMMLEQVYSETDDFRFTELDESYYLGDEILIKFEKITKQPCPSYEISMMKVGFPDSVMNYGVEPLCATLGPVNPYLFSEELDKAEFFDSVGTYLIKVKLDDETIQKEIKITDNRLMGDKFDSSFSINQKQMRYVIPYQISSGTVQDMQLECDPPTLTVSISSNDSGILEMEIPNPMMRSIFSVLVNGQEWDDVSIDGNTLTVIFPKFSNIIEINSGYLLTHEKNRDGACDVVHDPPHSFIISPLKQFDSGISLDEIQCKDNMTLIQKHDGTPACVQELSVSKLVERGWAISNGNHLSFDIITPESPLAKFYVQPQITSIILKQDSTVRVHLFSYIKEDDSDKWDHVFDRIFDEVPKNFKIGIVENTPNSINEFATLGKTNLPSGMQAELLREDGYFVVYLTLNKLSEPGNYDLSVVSIDNKGKRIQKPLSVIAVVADTPPTQDNTIKLHHSKYPWGINLESISEQEYWAREDSRSPWPPSPILDITQDNIHPDVNELIDAMWSEDAKYIQSEHDKKTLSVENDADLNVDPKKIRDWLKVVHDEQFKENLDDSFTGYIKYDGKIYSLGFIIVD